VEQPAVEVTEKKTVTGQAAPTPPPGDVPILVAEGSEEAVPAPAAEPAAPPEATSGLSTTVLIGLLCLLLVVAVIGWHVFRKSRSRA
jgi:hypothetical protein